MMRCYRFVVEPEGEPGDDHNHEAGDVDGDDVEAELPREHQVHPQTRVRARRRDHVAVPAQAIRGMIRAVKFETVYYLLVWFAILKPPGRERLAANCSAPSPFQM